MHDSDLIAFPSSPGASALPCDANTEHAVSAVKYLHATKPLTFGGCIAAACAICGPDRAEGLLRFAVNSGIVVFPGRRPVEIAPRDPRTDGLPNQHQVTGLIRYFLQDEPARRAVGPRSRRCRGRSAILRFAGPAPESTANVTTGWMLRGDSKTG